VFDHAGAKYDRPGGAGLVRHGHAALATTFVTSIAGAATFAALSLTTTGHVAPDWTVGLACGLGGLIGGYIGAHVQPHVPERALKLLLGALATVLAALYLVQGLS
jgi:uncharacterized membrane protein YfcA